MISHSMWGIVGILVPIRLEWENSYFPTLLLPVILSQTRDTAVVSIRLVFEVGSFGLFEHVSSITLGDYWQHPSKHCYGANFVLRTEIFESRWTLNILSNQFSAGTITSCLTLPLLRNSMSVSSSVNLLSPHVQMIHHHFQAYYQALELAASEDVSQVLYPDWRNSLEKPFLWLGDFHPNLFTNLLRSFLNEDSDNEGVCENVGKNLNFPLAWKYPSKALMSRVEQIECGLRLMVPTLVTRARKAQSGFIDRVAVDWVHREGRQEVSKAVGGAVLAQMEELLIVFMDANRLRRSILTEIMGATNVYQAALYLQGLAKFFVGFRDTELLHEFEQCRIPLSLTVNP